MKLTESKLREIIQEEIVNEASLRKVFNATKNGNFPVTLVAIENGKVVDQKLVGTREIVPAAFNVMQDDYPKAQVNVEDRTGKILFSESVVTEEIKSYNEKDTLYKQLHDKYAESIKGLKAGKIKKLTDLVSVQRWAMEDEHDTPGHDHKKMSATFKEERKLFKQWMGGDKEVQLRR